MSKVVRLTSFDAMGVGRDFAAAEGALIVVILGRQEVAQLHLELTEGARERWLRSIADFSFVS